jgi:L-ascorbate metabolism protein UlaG (beta-lactamase superfamily)
MNAKRGIFLISVLAALAIGAQAQARQAAPTGAAPRGVARIAYATSAMVEIVSPGGVRVLIDVYKPNLLSSPATDSDILLTTHGHYDHYNLPFWRAFKGQQLYVRAGAIEQGDVKITGIPSSHGDDAISGEKNGSNYLFLVETGGLRIVHMGDVGQTRLTDSQMATLGRIDVMITQFDNSYSNMSVENGKGFAIVAQVDPALVIPAHNSDAALRRQATEYSYVSSAGSFVPLDPEKIHAAREAAGKPLMLILGPDLESRAALCGAVPIDW